jgi:hypothetical protein
MDLFSFLSFHFMCVTVTVVTGHSVALSRRSHLFSTMSSLHDVLVHDIMLKLCMIHLIFYKSYFKAVLIQNTHKTLEVDIFISFHMFIIRM